MKLPNKIYIDILAFFKIGKFDYLKVGQTKEWILNNFPDPDDIGIGNTLMNSKIWRYGSIELHFEKDELSMIFSDSIGDLDGGQSLAFNKWILDDPSKLKLCYVIEKLNDERIDYAKETEKIDAGRIRIRITESNVQLDFAGEENELGNPNEFRLSSFSLSMY